MAYSHGLEKIYAFETINPKSVKSLAVKIEKDSSSISHVTPFQPTATEQLQFNYGPYFEESLADFRLLEPISSLGLTTFAHKALASRQLKTVEEVILFLKEPQGLGQGHLDELKTKLEAFVGKEPFKKRRTIHWQSLVRLLCHDLEAKERYVLLARYGLQELYPITLVEQQEVNRWSEEQIEKAHHLVRDKRAMLDASLFKIQEAFIRPWMRLQDGLCSKKEILAHLFQLSEDRTHFYEIQQMLQALATPLTLPLVDHDLYASDAAYALAYRNVIELLKSYFYQPFVRYPVKQLVHFAYVELIRQGHSLSARFIEKVLTHSSLFIVGHAESGQLEAGQRVLF